MKKAKFMNFIDDKRKNFYRFNYNDIKNNKYISEMFKPFYDFQKNETGNLETFYYFNKDSYKSIPNHLKDTIFYDPSRRTDIMFEERNKLFNKMYQKEKNLQLKSENFYNNGKNAKYGNTGDEKKYELQYEEETNDKYMFFFNYEFSQQNKPNYLRKSYKSPSLELKDSSGFKFRYSHKPQSPSISTTQNGKYTSKSSLSRAESEDNSKKHEYCKDYEKRSLLIDLFNREFNKNFCFEGKSFTEMFILETKKKIDQKNFCSMTPYLKLKNRSIINLCKEIHSKQMIIFLMNTSGNLKHSFSFSNLSDFDLSPKIKFSPFYLYYINKSYQLFENNWSFIYNMILKNPFMDNALVDKNYDECITLDFSRLITSVNYIKYILGVKIFETSKRSSSDFLIENLFTILEKCEQSKKEIEQNYENEHELYSFDSNKEFYKENNSITFDKQEYLENYCNFTNQLNENKIIQSQQITQFPKPILKKKFSQEENNMKIEEETDEPLIINGVKKDNNTEVKNFNIFSKKIINSSRFDMNFKKQAKRQMFSYKLKKFKTYKDKQLKKIKDEFLKKNPPISKSK